MANISELLEDVRFIIQFRKDYLKLQKALDHKAPKFGEMAPDFTLSDVAGTNSVTLSDFRGRKPVALIFGSYT